jgi:hypothetical protein
VRKLARRARLISYKIRKTVNRPAAVKLEAYLYARYGYLKGHVDRTAADAVTAKVGA